MGADGTCAYNDVGLATVMFAAFFLLTLWRNEKHAGLLIACCIVTGFALGVKYTAVYFALLVVAVIAVGLRGQPRRKLLPVLAAAGFALGVSLAPYLVRNILWFHDPIAFFGNAIFRNPYFHVSFERLYLEYQAHSHNLTWAEMPLQIPLGGANVEGCFGSIFLAAPLILAGVIWPQSRLLMLAALAAGLGFPHNRSIRFLIPALPMLAMVLTYVLNRLPASRIVLCVVAVAHLATSWPPLLDRIYRNPGWHLEHIPWHVALRKTPEAMWLMWHSEEYIITRKIDSLIPPDEPIFTTGGQLARSYTHRKVFVSYQSAFGDRLADLLYTTWYSPTTARMRWRFAFPSVSARDVRLVQDGRSENLQWSVNEVQLESNGQALPIGAGGHPYAWPNPWDAGMAFDGIEVTRWRTWEPLRPGMRLGVRFDNPVSLSGLTVLFVPDEWDSRMRLQILTDQGKWVDEPPPTLETLPRVDLRKQATRELKRQGFHYILVSRFDWNSSEFIAAAEKWGLAPSAGTPSYDLFRIE